MRRRGPGFRLLRAWLVFDRQNGNETCRLKSVEATPHGDWREVILLWHAQRMPLRLPSSAVRGT